MKRTSAAMATLFSAISWVVPAYAQGYMDRDWGWHSTWGWGHMMFGGLTMIVFWGGLIVLIVLLVRWLGNTGPNTQTSEQRRPLDMLQERFARGEIDKEEYEERKKVLSK